MLLTIIVFIALALWAFWFLNKGAFIYAYEKNGIKGALRMLVAFLVHKIAGFFVPSN
jgi:hypothetical protein